MIGVPMNKNVSVLFRSLLIILAFLLVSVLLLIGNYLVQPRPANAQSVDMKTKAIKWSGNGLKVELQTMPLDLVRAFFLGRGFAAADAEFIAQTGCIFRSAIGNSGTKTDDPEITVQLADWRVITPKGEHHPRTRQSWAATWDKKNISDNAKTAFYWAFFPTKQAYQPSDYNWGMISLALPPGSKFDLEIRWSMTGKPKTTMLKNLECGK